MPSFASDFEATYAIGLHVLDTWFSFDKFASKLIDPSKLCGRVELVSKYLNRAVKIEGSEHVAIQMSLTSVIIFG